MPGANSEVNRILGIVDDFDFLTELADAIEAARDNAKETLPSFRALVQLFAAVETGGIWQYLASRDGDDFASALAACATIGATDAAAFLKEVRARFPGAGVPTDAASRAAILDEIYLNAPLSDRKQPFALIEDRYDQSMPQMVQQARRYVTLHRAQIDQLIDESQDAQSAPLVEPSANEALRQYTLHVQQTAIRQAAVRDQFGGQFTSGLPPLSKDTDHPLKTFCESLATLSHDQWREIAGRFAAHPRKVKSAARHIRGLPYELLYTRGAFREHVSTPSVALFEPVLATTKALPEVLVEERQEFPLRRLAVQAATDAWFALARRRWLSSGKSERNALETLLEPFRGIAELPASKI